jgi:hypothetical protein
LSAVPACREPLPSQPVRRRPTARVRFMGEVRLPLAGSYRPRARLFRLPNGRLLWRIRLWEYDRAVPHVVPTDVLRTFARVNRLPELRRAIDALVERALEETRGRP